MRYLLSILCLSLTITGNSQKLLATLDIESSNSFQLEYPMEIDLKEGLVTKNSDLYLFEEGYDTRVPCQIENGEKTTIAFILPAREAPGSRQLKLYAQAKQRNVLKSGMKLSRNDSTLLISQNGAPVLHYRLSMLPPIPGQDQKWERNGFIHPLYSPSGKVLTWVQPADHLHHFGIWNPWTRVSWQGQNTDFWNQGDELGTVRFTKINEMHSGAVFGEFVSSHDHIAYLNKTDAASVNDPVTKSKVIPGKFEYIVLKEKWLVKVWNLKEGYLIDFVSILTNNTNNKVSLDAYRYGGGIGYRATEKWNNTNSSVITSEGKTWKDGDATRARWARVSGDLDGVETGLLFMCDTKNYDYPQPMRIWPKNNTGNIGYQYFEFTPIRENTWIITPDKDYYQKYRIWVQEGPISPDKAELAWQAYTNKLKVEISYYIP